MVQVNNHLYINNHNHLIVRNRRKRFVGSVLSLLFLPSLSFTTLLSCLIFDHSRWIDSRGSCWRSFERTLNLLKASDECFYSTSTAQFNPSSTNNRKPTAYLDLIPPCPIRLSPLPSTFFFHSFVFFFSLSTYFSPRFYTTRLKTAKH